MTPQKNCISQKWHLETFVIGLLKYYEYPAENPITMDLNHNTNLKIPFKKSFSLWHATFKHFFARYAIFVRHHFLWVLYLSILGGVFVICHFCKVPLFSNGIKGCFFCWVPFLLGVFDVGVFVFFYS